MSYTDPRYNPALDRDPERFVALNIADTVHDERDLEESQAISPYGAYAVFDGWRVTPWMTRDAAIDLAIAMNRADRARFEARYRAKYGAGATA